MWEVIYMKYELVCGLETHVELLTEEKIFCRCKAGFGGEPNTSVCPVCLGMPGALPLLNMQAVELAVRAGIALGCEINTVSFFDRKNYFYPDLPKGYQISQYDRPICGKGKLTLPSGREIAIERIHLEEDAGKLMYENGEILADYNRGGVPLIEIITEPCFDSPQLVREYLEELRLIMKHVGVSDCRMQEGSLRSDVNVSVRESGSDELGTRTEVKNVNSIMFSQKAVEYEYNRQCEILENGGKVESRTLRWSEKNNRTEPMREKENAKDYRFMREPDLAPLCITEEYIEKIRASMPLLPSQRREKYMNEGISAEDSALLARYKKIAEYFDSVCEDGADPKTASKLLLGRVFAYLKTEDDYENCRIPIEAKTLSALAKLLYERTINATVARETLEKLIENGGEIGDYLSEDDLKKTDDSELSELCRQVIEENGKICDDYRSGKEKAIMPLVGAVMKKSKGRADAVSAKQMIENLLRG